ncbi:hypothetical protein K2X40_02820 [Candidatus Babeliales bacterium]|nr:hypothetical protein [Candidatus Babeliales bacterium]
MKFNRIIAAALCAATLTGNVATARCSTKHVVIGVISTAALATAAAVLVPFEMVQKLFSKNELDQASLDMCFKDDNEGKLLLVDPQLDSKNTQDELAAEEPVDEDFNLIYGNDLVVTTVVTTEDTADFYLVCVDSDFVAHEEALVKVEETLETETTNTPQDSKQETTQRYGLLGIYDMLKS